MREENLLNTSKRGLLYREELGGGGWGGGVTSTPKNTKLIPPYAGKGKKGKKLKYCARKYYIKK